MTDRELMQQALEKLEFFAHMKSVSEETMRLITALRERLAQPEQEPVDSDEKAGAYMDARLWDFIDMAAAWPEAKPDSRTWDHVLVYAPKQPVQEPVKFKCTVIDDAHLNGVPLSQWGKQHEMQPCAGRNCGSTNPNLHSAECFEDYEAATGMNQWVGLTDEEIESLWDNGLSENVGVTALRKIVRAIEAKLREKNA